MTLLELIQLVANVVLAVGLLCGGLSQFVNPTTKLGKFLNVFGMATTKVAKYLNTNTAAPAAERPTLRVMSGSIVFLVLLLLPGCAPAKKIWDTAYDTCVVALRLEPAFISAAQTRGQTALDYAKLYAI